MDVSEIAQLLEKTARQIYIERGPQAIHPGQWSVLRFLADASYEHRDVHGVAKHLAVTLAPASRAISALEERELVTGEYVPTDRRKRKISLTKLGYDVLKGDPIKRVENILSDMEAVRREEFSLVLSELSAGLKE